MKCEHTHTHTCTTHIIININIIAIMCVQPCSFHCKNCWNLFKYHEISWMNERLSHAFASSVQKINVYLIEQRGRGGSILYSERISTRLGYRQFVESSVSVRDYDDDEDDHDDHDDHDDEKCVLAKFIAIPQFGLFFCELLPNQKWASVSEVRKNNSKYMHACD